MISRAALRATAKPTLIARRGFQSTRAQRAGHGDLPGPGGASPYHYPEGPRSNLPFDPLKKGFAFRFWGFCGKLGPATITGKRLMPLATGFLLPFGLAGEKEYSVFIISHPSNKILLQSGKRRRTNKYYGKKLGVAFRGTAWARNAYCRVKGVPANNCTTQRLQHQFHWQCSLEVRPEYL